MLIELTLILILTASNPNFYPKILICNFVFYSYPISRILQYGQYLNIYIITKNAGVKKIYDVLMVIRFCNFLIISAMFHRDTDFFVIVIALF